MCLSVSGVTSKKPQGYGTASAMGMHVDYTQTDHTHGRRNSEEREGGVGGGIGVRVVTDRVGELQGGREGGGGRE
jgi:hypothetical protein